MGSPHGDDEVRKDGVKKRDDLYNSLQYNHIPNDCLWVLINQYDYLYVEIVLILI